MTTATAASTNSAKQTPRPRAQPAPVFFAHKHPGLTANPESAEFAKGYAAHQGGGWWRGCPHCHDTQEFADWQAGWHQSYNEADSLRNSRFEAFFTPSFFE